MIAQWGQRRDRGIAMGILGTFTGGAMLLMWWISGFVGAEFGWRAAFRYPPLVITLLGVAFFLTWGDLMSGRYPPSFKKTWRGLTWRLG